MDVEQRYVISYYLKKNVKPTRIIEKLQKVYGPKAYKRSDIYRWIGIIRGGRENLTNVTSPGRPIENYSDDLIKNCLETDPYASARMIARRTKIPLTTVLDRLHNVFNLKNYHLRWVPHKLNIDQMKKRVTLAKSMLQILQQAEKRKYKFILTGDESWFEYYYGVKRMWLQCRDQREDIVNQTIERKIMIILFFNGEGLQFLQIKPSGLKINAEYYLNNVIKKLETLDVALQARKQKQKMIIHYDNAPAHNSKIVSNYILDSLFTRMPHPPYSPDLAPCDFGVFGTVKESFEGQEFETEDELLSAIVRFLNSKSQEFWFSLFENWKKRLRRCIDKKGDYID